MIAYRQSGHSPSEIETSLQLVRESFGDVDMAYGDYYDWLFLQNPVGKGTVVLAYDGEHPVGQVASIPCNYLDADGEPLKITLTMNVCVSENYRGQGILTELMKQIHKDSDVPFSIGVPNNQSMKGHLKNGYHPLPMKLLIKPLWKKGRSAEPLQRFDKGFDIDNFIRQERSARFLNWRYVDNPHRKYTVFANNSGYVVARIADIEGKKRGLIVDCVGADKSLIENALAYFWDNGIRFAAAACFPNCIEYDVLKKSGFHQIPERFKPHPLALCVKTLNDGKAALDSRKWFFMLGDYETF